MPNPNHPLKKAKIVIIDDHPLTREGLKRLINHEDDLVVCGEAGDSHSALAIVKKTKPTVITLDLSLEESHGIDLLSILRSKYPKIAILVISMHDESLYAERVLRAGAKGYIMKHQASEQVLEALRSVIKGNVYASSEIQNRLLQQSKRGAASGKSPVETLSNRELQVFELIGKGKGTRQIAEALELSIKTIETNRARIKDKLKLKTAAQLVHFAIEWVQKSSKLA